MGSRLTHGVGLDGDDGGVCGCADGGDCSDGAVLSVDKRDDEAEKGNNRGGTHDCGSWFC